MRAWHGARTVPRAWRWAVVVVWAALAWTAAPGASGQEAGEPQNRGYRSDVDVVIVDAVVRDQQGNHVIDLGVDEFTVLEDGTPVAITFFQREAFSTVAGSGVVGAYRNFVLLVDGYNSEPGHIDGARQAMHAFVANVQPTDRVMLAALVPDGRLLMPVEFPGDRDALHHYIEQLPGSPEMDALVQTRESEVVEQLYGEPAFEDPAGGGSFDYESERRKVQSAFGLVRTYSEGEARRARHTLDAIATFGNFLAGSAMPPGPKLIVLVSAGLPSRPGYSYLEIVNERVEQLNAMMRSGSVNKPLFSRQDSTIDLAEIIERAATELSNGNTTVYALDAEGLPKRLGEDPVQGDRTHRLPAGLRMLAFADRERSMTLMAQATGGLAFTGAGGYENALTRILHDSAFRYVLGFRPRDGDREDGEIIPIEVKTSRPGVEIRSRTGYVGSRR